LSQDFFLAVRTFSSLQEKKLCQEKKLSPEKKTWGKETTCSVTLSSEIFLATGKISVFVVIVI